MRCAPTSTSKPQNSTMAGLAPEQAAYAARRALGNVTYLKEDVRSMWGWTRWDILLQDLRYAMRTLRRSPGFAATAILTLTLGIGASTAVFSIFDTAILNPLAFPDSRRLVVAWERVRWLSTDPTGPNPRHVDIWQKRATAFSGLTFSGLSARERVVRRRASEGRRRGRLPAESLRRARSASAPGPSFSPRRRCQRPRQRRGLTDSARQSLFEGEPAAVGRTIRIDDVPRQVIGVLPAGFQFPRAKGSPRSFRSRQPVRGVPEPGSFSPSRST